MSNVTRSGRNEICERNVAYHPEVPWVWSSDPGSLDLEESHIRILYEWYMYMMSSLIGSGRNEICKRNVAYYSEVPWVWSSDPESLDLEESDIRTWYEWYIWWLIWLEAGGTKFVREMLHSILKFPEFEIVTLEALIGGNLIWGFDMNNIHLMSNSIGSEGKEIYKRNFA